MNPETSTQLPATRTQNPEPRTQNPEPRNQVSALVLTGYGLNCDVETAYALELAGAKARRVHINALIDGSVNLDDFQILIFGGGFSWGDDHGAGVVLATRMKSRMGDEILEFIEKEKLVLGICNGFQTLVNLGLLPGFGGDYSTRSVAVTYNDCGNFQNRWVYLEVDPESPCIFTNGLKRLELPVRHGEGKVYAEPDILDKLDANNQVAVRYSLPGGEKANGVFPFNPNGSLNDIAGICDTTGRIFGLMPHPEAYNHWTNHPDWTREKEAARRKAMPAFSVMAPGIRLFQNAVGFFQENGGQSS